MILELIRAESLLARAFSWTPLRRLGQISYGFYVFHDLPHTAFNTLAPMMGLKGLWPVAVMGLIGTVVVSALSFRYFELPILRLKRYFADQVHTAPGLHAA